MIYKLLSIRTNDTSKTQETATESACQSLFVWVAPRPVHASLAAQVPVAAPGNSSAETGPGF